MKQLFETRNLGTNSGDKPNEFWATFIVNVFDSSDRYMVTSPTDKKTADYFTTENNRLAMEWLREIEEGS